MQKGASHVRDGTRNNQDLSPDNVALAPPSIASTENIARQNARDALQHMEHAHVEMSKMIHDHAQNAKKDAEWLETVQDRLDAVCSFSIYICFDVILFYQISDAIGDVLLGGPQPDVTANDRFNRIVDICLAYQSLGSSERFIAQCVRHLGDASLVWVLLRKQ